MDEALKAAWRAAQATPDDAQARAAYGQALLRSGRRLAAAFELEEARRLSDPRGKPRLLSREVVFERPVLPGGAPVRWGVGPRPAGLETPTPPLADPQLGHVLLMHQPEVGVLAALVPWPVCPDCLARRTPDRPGAMTDGRTACGRCDGRGEIIEFTGRAEERHPCDRCDGTGEMFCPRCDGAGLVPARGRAAACEHAALGPRLVTDEAPLTLGIGELGEWTVHRCQACGLCVLRDPSEDLHPACAGCGTFACDGTCDVSTGSDP